ncbi:23S rRNA (adenine(2503)-C(2))-methyltransferase RlmN [Clostridium pasteurianum]|uniref:Probable dual-specificity RNA methyltransferase RlmN n=1 Tax=Clostridium pasteurianum BC1 TaxID=86416 RepID=R4K6I5_CLOPA|nr:23S rRNA (adenine(2503)-C(2))-methyltransferase RlmN [Clostridium pasteurianum]AGK97316.1 23S rRNA m2A2503 methyltransferase [Clostridium pasteurianum BC1]
MINILDFDLAALKNWMKENGEKEFRAKQVFNWIYNEVWDFYNMNNIPKSTKDKLNSFFYIGIPELLEVYDSEDNNTKKFLYRYKDGSIIECVAMEYTYGNSICVSTQVGCKMGCKFCASTIGGIIRNLTAGEITAQILKTQSIIHKRISNVVLMGSGEPLDNYENVIAFINDINNDYSLNIGQRHITLSTCGIVPKIYDLADLKLQITLAISLHASSDEERKKIMPIANKYNIQELIKACTYYISKTNRRITFEYALVKGINDNEDSARKLGELLKNILCHVNLIPVNTVTENNFKKPSKENIKIFSNILNDFGINNTIRREMGSDINAACGQLRRSYAKSIEKRC